MTRSNAKIRRSDLLYPELSYEIQGAAMAVRQQYGPGHKESLYQRAFAEELSARNIKFVQEPRIAIRSSRSGKILGWYQPDFLIENKIIIELKAVPQLPRQFINQLYDYLRNTEYELGYLINFSGPKLFLKRIVYANARKFNPSR